MTIFYAANKNLKNWQNEGWIIIIFAALIIIIHSTLIIINVIQIIKTSFNK